MLDALEEARSLVRARRMSQAEFDSFASILKVEAKLPGLSTILRSTSSSESSSSSGNTDTIVLKLFVSLRRALRRKDLTVVHALLRDIYKCDVPSMDTIKTSGMGRLLDKVSKRIKDRQTKDLAGTIMRKWKGILRQRRASSRPGKRVFMKATAPVARARHGHDGPLARLLSMGFEKSNAMSALHSSGGDLDRAVAMLVSEGHTGVGH